MGERQLDEVGKALDRPTRQEVLERLTAKSARQLQRDPADVIRDERAAR